MLTTETERDALDALMGFGHVVIVHPDRTFADAQGTEQGITADEVLYVELNEDGQAVGEPDLTVSGFGDGWSLLTGWTGQYGYSGPVMHSSEYIGGALADHIITTPGLWVAVMVDGQMPTDESADDVESVSVGWALLHHDLTA